MDLLEFSRCCEGIAERGFSVREAGYSDAAFGSWSIEFSAKQVAPHRLTWVGRNRWLLLKSERPDGERTVRVSFEE